MADPLLPPPASPTGTPIIPPKFVGPVLLVLGMLGPVALLLQDPAPWDAAKFGKLLAMELPGVMGILSPGLRKSDGA